MKRSTEIFIAGFSINVCLTSLFADFMGRERYAQWVLDYWMDSTITIPSAILSIVLWIVILVWRREPKTNHE